MPSRREQLRRIAVAMVAEGYEYTLYDLSARLQRETGASSQEANRTLMELLGNGTLRTTFGSRVALGRSRGGGGHWLRNVSAFLGIVVSLLTIWEIGARNGWFPGPGPIDIVFRDGDSNGSTPSTDGTIPTIPMGEQLEAPEASITGNCETGFTITWGPVDGAESYRIEVDGHFRSTELGTDFFIPGEQAFQEQRYEVFAEALLRPRSDASDAMVAGPCPFAP